MVGGHPGDSETFSEGSLKFRPELCLPQKSYFGVLTPVTQNAALFGDSLYRDYNKISLYRSENNIRVGPNQIGLMSLFSSVQLLSRVSLFATPWTAAHQASLSITNSRTYSNSCPLSWCDAIQPSHPLLSPSPPAFNLSQHQGLFQCQFFASGGQSIGVSASTSVLPMNTQD